MTDEQSLFAVVVLIYLSDCIVWLGSDAIAIIITASGRVVVRNTTSWASNDRGALVFTTLLPARAVFLCSPSEEQSFDGEAVQRTASALLRDTRRLHSYVVALFLILFVFAPAISVSFGFAHVGLPLVAVLLILSTTAAAQFVRAHRRVAPTELVHRWTYAPVMVVAVPTAIRLLDHVTRSAMKSFDPIAVAAALAGKNDEVVRMLARELAHPRPDTAQSPRLNPARAAGFVSDDDKPPRPTGAASFCPRCHCTYDDDARACADCDVSLASF